MNLKTSRKIGGAFLLTIIVSLVASIITWQNLVTLAQNNQWTIHTYKVIDQTKALVSAMVDAETGVRGFLVAGTDNFLEPYRNSDAAFKTALNDVKQLTSDNPAQQRRFEQIEKAAMGWRQEVAEKEIALMRNPQTVAEARNLVASGIGKKYMDGLRGLVKEVIDAEASLLQTRADAAEAALASSKTAIVTGGLVMVVIALLSLIILNSAVTRGITSMTVAMGRLANNDLSVAIPYADRRDEVGEMAKAVQVFKDNAIRVQALEAEQKETERRQAEQRRQDMLALANRFEQAVGEIVDTVSSASTQLEASAGSLSKTAERSQEMSTTVASASEEASANVQSVASATEELSSSVTEISRQVQESARMANEAVGQARKTNEQVAELSKAAGRIGDVVELINTIAGQTNLLALNATIEAARAGEAGRGFAVVATEVKALAEQTAKATGEIGQQIGSIQTATNESVDAIRAISTTIEKLSEIASTIAAAVEEQGAATQEISRNVQQAASGTQQVSTNVVQVQRGAAETGSASSQVLAAAKSLSRDSERLKVEIGRFLTTVRAA
ncbi:methyl-accepting chemotaxis protein [Bradyrhizobium sp. SRS-191]|uniref:methyl-accepting chemotaxis protein n=1 Tax=Bradyrhizobium sp. SRS-191 TaxID=2962606 RepID=UPI00211DE248|nr:CHASE3 domain-containing protein [Bradyrhizobium sp. SRS-191]